MRTLLYLVVAFALGAASNLQAQSTYTGTFSYSDIAYVPNPQLPPDAVEVAPTQPFGPDVFYWEKPTARPQGLPDSYVLVGCYRRVAAEEYQFVGWIWLDWREVSNLHATTVSL